MINFTTQEILETLSIDTIDYDETFENTKRLTIQFNTKSNLELHLVEKFVERLLEIHINKNENK